MAKASRQAHTEPAAPSSYDMLCERVMRQVNSAKGEVDKHVHVERWGAGEADWERLLGDIAENDSVTIARRDDGSADLFWKVPREF